MLHRSGAGLPNHPTQANRAQNQEPTSQKPKPPYHDFSHSEGAIEHMQIAIISDIHGNAVALESVLNELKQEHIGHVVCLGDIATDGPQPREVIAQLKTLDSSVVMGNMDAWILKPPPREERVRRIKEIQFWSVSQLSPDDLDYLRTFRSTVELPLDETTGLLCYHGSPQSNEQSVSSTTADEDLERMLSGYQATVLAGGHTHRQMVRRYGDITLLNPGSVGAPIPVTGHDPHPAWAEYGVIGWEENGHRVELRRVPLDVALLADSARDSGMPHADWWLTLRYGPSAK